jgi:protein involved in polysaccharide export with SLBB domain
MTEIFPVIRHLRNSVSAAVIALSLCTMANAQFVPSMTGAPTTGATGFGGTPSAASGLGDAATQSGGGTAGAFGVEQNTYRATSQSGGAPSATSDRAGSDAAANLGGRASLRSTPSRAQIETDAPNLRGQRSPSDVPFEGESRTVEQPSQFQQFVLQATGHLLPVYGRDLFDRPQSYVADSSAPAPSNYILGPGDSVHLQVWGGVEFNETMTIDRNGQISLPRVGALTLAGVRLGDAETTIRNKLGTTFTNFSLNANLDRLRTIQVYVVGQVRQPGTHNLSSLSTLVNALFASGGPTSNGSMRNIQLKRGDRLVTSLDLYDFIGKGDKSRDVPLQAGDVIVIPPVGPRVAITGALDRSAIYELKSEGGRETTLNDILSINGGVPVLASTGKAILERVVPGQNPPRQLTDLVLSSGGLQERLRDGDVITLFPISPAFSNVVTLQGNVAAPLRYRWFPGMKIRDLIPEKEALITADYYQRKNLLVQNAEKIIDSRDAGNNIATRVRGIVDQINWEYAVVERLDSERLRTQLIPFNLGAAVIRGDASQNLLLQPGDVVTVLSERDLRLPVERKSRLVRVEGEVAAPGVYEILPGETIAQLIYRLGGLTSQAYVYGTEFDRVSVRERQQVNLDLLIRRVEQQTQSQAAFIAANRTSTDAAAIIQQQQASGRAQLEALRKLKSNGRVALELDPAITTVAALPDLPLEDGDRILVPARPGFVSVVGAVNNENVYVYKPGRTVAEVLKSAGVREEADPKEMFVLRADGSIVAAKERSGFFGSNFESLALMPGDAVFIPEKLDRETARNYLARQVRDYTGILSQLGLSLAAFAVLKDR